MESDVKAYINPYIEHYLKEKEISQSILITGIWGCGKTHYWKNILSSKIKEQNLKPIYISLNGLKNKQEILNELSLKILVQKSNNMINKKTISICKGLKDFFNPFISRTLSLPKNININLPLSTFLNIEKLDNYVLCFDDLERYTGNISDVLGIINDFTEQKHIKTIVLANIDKIKNTINSNTKDTDSNNKEQSTAQNEDINNFNIIKEKFFAKIIAFPDDRNTKKYILEEIINEMDISEKTFLLENVELILNIMKQAKTSNYRVIKILLNDFSYFYSENMLNQINDENTFYEIKKHFFKYLLCSGLVIYINNLSDDDIKSLKSDSTFDIFKYMNNDNTPTFLKKFIDKFYLGDIESAYTFPSIIDYHLTSKIDIKKLNDEIKKYTPKKYKNYEYLTSGTSEYFYLKDEEFDKIINNDLIDDIKNGNVHYAYYDELFIKYCSLSEDKLIDKPYNELKKIFIAGLNKIQQEKKQNPAYEDNYTYTFKKEYKSLIEDKNIDYNSILSEIEKTHIILKENFYSEKSIELKEKLKNDTSSFIDYLSPMKNSHYEDIKYPLFSNFDEKDLFDILSNMTNKDIWEFTNVIIGRYKYGGISSYYNYDCKFLKKFSQYVQKEFSQKEKLKLSEGLILNFVKQIDSLPIQNKENITDNK